MKSQVIKITDCKSCPFSSVGDKEAYCRASNKRITTNLSHWPIQPSHCPLRDDQGILVKFVS